MTHYRLTLTRGRKPVKMLAERHSYSHTPPSGWWRSVQLVGSSVHVRVCWVPDAACEALGAPGGAPVDPSPEPPHTPTPAPKGSEAGACGSARSSCASSRSTRRSRASASPPD